MANNALKSTDITGTLTTTSTATIGGATTINATPLTVGANSTSATRVNCNGAAGSTRAFQLQSAGSLRAALTLSSTAESGSDAGSNPAISCYTDAGAFIDSPVSIVRAAGGTLTLSRPVSATSTLSVTGALTLGAARYDKVVTLTDAATIATDASLGNVFTVTLGGNRTLGAPTNPTNGQRITYVIRQDATGSRTLAYNAAFRFSTTRPSPTLTTTAAKTDYLEFIYNSTDSKWDVVNIDLGH